MQSNTNLNITPRKVHRIGSEHIVLPEASCFNHGGHENCNCKCLFWPYVASSLHSRPYADLLSRAAVSSSLVAVIPCSPIGWSSPHTTLTSISRQSASSVWPLVLPAPHLASREGRHTVALHTAHMHSALPCRRSTEKKVPSRTRSKFWIHRLNNSWF